MSWLAQRAGVPDSLRNQTQILRRRVHAAGRHTPYASPWLKQPGEIPPSSKVPSATESLLPGALLSYCPAHAQA
jgi:hypothetical protein